MMAAKRVFVTRVIPDEGLAVLREADLEVVVGQSDPEASVPCDVLASGTADADALLCLLTEPITRQLLASAPRLRGVATMAVGYDNVDVAAATELGLPVSNTPGVLTETTADLAWALILATARRVPQAHAYMAAGQYKMWGPLSFLGEDVSPGGDGRRRVLGIIGFGRIGEAVARRSVGFDMEVLAFDPRCPERIQEHPIPVWAELDELLRRSDVVTVHTPLTEATRHLIGADELRQMKPSAVLINTARGPIVDEQALVEALRAKVISGAGLDVYEQEPLMAPGLAELDSVVLLPHIGSASRATRGLMARLAAEAVVAHLAGRRAEHVVNSEVYDSQAYRRRLVKAES